MDRWYGKVAVVTGASSGIGAAIAVDLVKAGLTVVGLARRQERVEQLREVVPSTATGKLFAIKCDVTQESDIKNSFAWVTKNFGGVDILINNAGTIKTINLVDEDNTAALRETIDTNILAVALCTREAFQSMKNRGVDGHIVLINSLTGHYIPYFVGLYPSFNMYAATKHAVTAMTEVLRQEFQSFNTRVKITSISPGAVKTEIFKPEFLEVVKDVPFLAAEDVSQAVLYTLGTPPHVQIHELIIKPLGERA